MRINDDDFPTLAEFAERLELRELDQLARMMMTLFPEGMRRDNVHNKPPAPDDVF